MYALLLNGPPRSGKDTIADHMRNRMDDALYPAIKRSLSMPMRLAGFALLGLPYSDAAYERIKDLPQDIFAGETLRRWMIDFSERFIKPAYGQEFWAASLLNPFQDLTIPGLMIVPDLGFAAELDYISQRLGNKRVLNVWVAREGKTFEGDSRSYVIGCESPYILPLYHEEHGAEAATSRIITHMTSNLGWVF